MPKKRHPKCQTEARFDTVYMIRSRRRRVWRRGYASAGLCLYHARIICYKLQLLILILILILSFIGTCSRVQHRLSGLTRMIPGLGKICYEDRREYLRLWTLEERWNRSDTLEVLRMFQGLFLTLFNHFFFTLNTSANTRGHSAKIVKNRCRLDYLKVWDSQVVVVVVMLSMGEGKASIPTS